jgi:transposase
METYQRTYSARTAKAQRRSAQSKRPSLPDWNPVYSQDWYALGVSAPGNVLWQRHDLLASSARLANRWCLAEDMAGLAGRVGHGRCNRLVYFRHGQLFSSRTFWGAKTGPNPTDRGKNGSKRHLIVDGQGTPLAIEHTGANVHDSEMAIALVDGIPPIKQPRGRPRRRPDEVLADRAYDAEEKIRQPLRRRKTKPLIAKRNTENGSGLGKFRYVVEAAFDWLFNQRRLRVRYEKRDDIHQAFLTIGCFLICWRRIMEFC